MPCEQREPALEGDTQNLAFVGNLQQKENGTNEKTWCLLVTLKDPENVPSEHIPREVGTSEGRTSGASHDLRKIT